MVNNQVELLFDFFKKSILLDTLGSRCRKLFSSSHLESVTKVTS